MLDIKRLRNEFEEVKRLILLRGKGEFGIDSILELDLKRRELLTKVETMKNEQKTKSKEIPKYKKEGKNTEALMEELKNLSEEIKGYDDKVKAVDDSLKELLL